MPNARPTPGLRLTPERRAEIRHAIKHNPEVDAQDALDLLHDLDVLERERDEARREVERLRELLGEARVIVAVMADPNAYAPWRRKVARALLPQIDAALATLRGEGHA